MTAGASLAARAGFRSKYAAALPTHLAEPTEVTLHAAYELGREAVALELPILDVASIHHEVLADCVRAGTLAAAEQAITAGEFLTESLSAFEMVHRGFREAQEQRAVERRSAKLLQRLSTVLADESLAASNGLSVGEALQLVAEQARELVGAARCTVRTNEDVLEAACEVTASDDPDEPLVDGAPERDRLLVRLRALRGDSLGSLELVAAEGATFTEREKHVAVHVGEMASAAVERIRLYRSSRPRLVT